MKLKMTGVANRYWHHKFESPINSPPIKNKEAGRLSSIRGRI